MLKPTAVIPLHTTHWLHAGQNPSSLSTAVVPGFPPAMTAMMNSNIGVPDPPTSTQTAPPVDYQGLAGEVEEIFSIVPAPSRAFLNERQADEYFAYRKRLLIWLLTAGKDPDNQKGLALRTAKNYASRIDQFYRWIWQQHGYMTHVTHPVADQYVTGLATDAVQQTTGELYSASSKRKMVNAVSKLFEWRHHTFGDDRWTPDRTFSERRYTHADALTVEERHRLREGVLAFETIPAYNNLSPEERDRWKSYLAQLLGKKKAAISPDDWESVNMSWKFPSLFRTALDTGLRPCEVEQAKTHWLRAEKHTLYIPKEDAAKNRENWEVALRPDTVFALEKWIVQRANQEMYDDRDELWLNRQGNPYTSKTLNHWFRKLCDEVGIDREHRNLTWYSIRHSVGTLMVSRGTLAEARDQLRHKSTASTLQYVHTTPDDRRETLEKMG